VIKSLTDEQICPTPTTYGVFLLTSSPTPTINFFTDFASFQINEHYNISTISTIDHYVVVQGPRRPSTHTFIHSHVMCLHNFCSVVKAWNYTLLSGVPCYKHIPYETEYLEGLEFSTEYWRNTISSVMVTMATTKQIPQLKMSLYLVSFGICDRLHWYSLCNHRWRDTRITK
jgi:hypothetical protein